MTFLEILGIIWITLLISNLLFAIKQAKMQIRKEIIEKEVDRLVKEIYIDAIETDGQKYFLVYDANTNHYIAQGRTQEEIQANIKLRFPDVVFVINGENLQKIGG